MFRRNAKPAQVSTQDVPTGDGLPVTLTLRDLSEPDLNTVAGGSQSTGAGAGKITFNPF